MPRLSPFGFVSVILLACAPAQGLHPALLVLPGAVGLESAPTNEIGEQKIEYHFSMAFPAQAATEAISWHLAELGYQPRTENLLNPGHLLLAGDAWSSFGDMTTDPESCVRQWWREWQDREGTVVTYVLVYRWPSGSDRLCQGDVKVDEVFLLAIVAPYEAVVWHQEATSS